MFSTFCKKSNSKGATRENSIHTQINFSLHTFFCSYHRIDKEKQGAENSNKKDAARSLGAVFGESACPGVVLKTNCRHYT